MKVDINHSEKQTGLLRKTTHYVVKLIVTFSEEERQIIKDRNLKGETILERPVPSDRKPEQFNGIEDVFNLRISTIMDGKPDEYALSTVAEAKEYDAALRDAMHDLKAFISANAEVENKSSSFEL